MFFVSLIHMMVRVERRRPAKLAQVEWTGFSGR
jgi:hypothetical protein